MRVEEEANEAGRDDAEREVRGLRVFWASVRGLEASRRSLGCWLGDRDGSGCEGGPVLGDMPVGIAGFLSDQSLQATNAIVGST